MVTDGVSFGDDALDQVGVSFGRAADEKKGPLDAVLPQHVEHLRRVSGVRTVIKG
jgi:hypothetical protein